MPKASSVDFRLRPRTNAIVPANDHGLFLKEKQLAMMQTPHHFFSPARLNATWGVFVKHRTKARCSWSGAGWQRYVGRHFLLRFLWVIRRKPLDEIGGIAVETVTEMRILLCVCTVVDIPPRICVSAGGGAGDRKSVGAYRSAYSWARGMVQIFRLDNPLTGKGRSLLSGCATSTPCSTSCRAFTADLPDCAAGVPAASCLHHLAPALMIALFVLPHMIHASLTTRRSRANIATLSGVKSTKRAGVVYRTTDAGGAD